MKIFPECLLSYQLELKLREKRRNIYLFIYFATNIQVIVGLSWSLHFNLVNLAQK